MNYMRKQVVVLAEQYDGTQESIDKILLMKKNTGNRSSVNHSYAQVGQELRIHFPPDISLSICPGSWVIKTTSREFQVLSDEQFKSEYSPTGI